MSSRAQVLSLASQLGAGQPDPVTLEAYFGDVLAELGQRPWLTTASLLPVAIGQGTFNPPDGHVRTLGVAYDDVWLAPARLRELEWMDPQWRDRAGSPIVFVREAETTETFRLFPVPDTPSKPFSFVTGSPMGTDFPTYSVVLLHTETRDTVPDWLDLPIALAVLARDFARESPYRDAAFAKLCDQLAALLLRFVA